MDGSILPMTIVDDNDSVVEEIACVSMSGGADYIEGMPRRLSLMRTHVGRSQIWAEYEFKGIVDPPVADR